MFHLTKYRNLGRDAFVATLATHGGREVGHVWQRPGQRPGMRFASAGTRDRFLRWVKAHAQPYSRADDATLLVVGAQMLRTWMHLDHAPGLCYRLAGDPDPWDSGMIRRLPPQMSPLLAKLHLADRFPDQIPQIWDSEAHAFVPVYLTERSCELADQVDLGDSTGITQA